MKQKELSVKHKSVHKISNFHICGHFEHIIIPQLLIKMYFLTLNYAEFFHYSIPWGNRQSQLESTVTKGLKSTAILFTLQNKLTKPEDKSTNTGMDEPNKIIHYLAVYFLISNCTISHRSLPYTNKLAFKEVFNFHRSKDGFIVVLLQQIHFASSS